MIRRLLARLIPGRKTHAPRIYGPADHPVRSDQVSRGARMVTEKLHEAGFRAFVVGGAVRDLPVRGTAGSDGRVQRERWIAVPRMRNDR